MRLRVILGFLLVFYPACVQAVQVDEILSNPALEQRARALSGQLRCLVCQNQSIDDSDAPLARDLRLLVRERLVAGDSDEAVKAFLVDRYGEFILLKPTFEPKNYLLWAFPAICLGAALVFVLTARRKVSAFQEEPINPAEAARLKALLEDEPS